MSKPVFFSTLYQLLPQTYAQCLSLYTPTSSSNSSRSILAVTSNATLWSTPTAHRSINSSLLQIDFLLLGDCGQCRSYYRYYFHWWSQLPQPLDFARETLILHRFLFLLLLYSNTHHQELESCQRIEHSSLSSRGPQRVAACVQSHGHFRFEVADNLHLCVSVFSITGCPLLWCSYQLLAHCSPFLGHRLQCTTSATYGVCSCAEFVRAWCTHWAHVQPIPLFPCTSGTGVILLLVNFYLHGH